ncbi:TetR/AcrR family transcriptional regulator [Mycolicibacterium mengxianglii]|uniref:TetR/AcrR family transcriptional regulator n=1 Tax=Mycolicibacterium mengxianglii TaxID=2736649 RepID=UPI0018EECD0F|nr:TetR/AcrR family transcriptional regulator [Mycolicibacterium mengxianglii]
MESGRQRLIEAARALLAEHPDREPSTRELYEAAGVAAPTLYHHFGTKEGLLDAVAEDAFATYVERKNAVPDTGDLLADFTAGWDMHIEFGVQNPVLYRFMFGRTDGRRCEVAQKAETELRRRLARFADEGLLQISLDEAIAVTTGTAMGCVMQLVHDGGSATGPVALTMRAALIAQLTEQPSQRDDPGRAAHLLQARLGSASELFTSAEEALLRQWLRTLAEYFDNSPANESTSRGRHE